MANTQNAPQSALGAALAAVKVAEPTPTPAPVPAKVSMGEALPMLEGNKPEKDDLPAGDGDIDRLFTSVRFVHVSGDIYARERDRRGKESITVGFSRKVAEVQIELAGTGIYTPGTISIVQAKGEADAHLEMSVGVWNPDTRKSSIQCATAATKERFQAWKDKTCGEFLQQCNDAGIDLAAPVVKQHANTLKINLLASAPASK
jgi:hypothetical protein